MQLVDLPLGRLDFSPQHHAGMNGGTTITYVGDKLELINKFTDAKK